MTPLIMYAAFAGGMGWGVHKRKWGVAAFFGAMMVWMIVIELAVALMSSHSGVPVSF